MVSMAVLIPTISSGIHTHPVSWNRAYNLRVELSDGGCFPNLVRNCCWTIVPRQSFWITLYITPTQEFLDSLLSRAFSNISFYKGRLLLLVYVQQVYHVTLKISRNMLLKYVCSILTSKFYILTCIFQNPNKMLTSNLEKEYRNFALLTN